LAEEYKKLQWKLHPDKFSDLSKVFYATNSLHEGYFQNVAITNLVGNKPKETILRMKKA